MLLLKPSKINEDFRFVDNQDDLKVEDIYRWIFSYEEKSIYCLINGHYSEEIYLDEIKTIKHINHVLLFFYKKHGRFSMIRLAKIMNKISKNICGLTYQDFNDMLSKNSDDDAPWVGLI